MIPRDALAATRVAVVEEGEGLRLTPPSTAALGRAVAVVRAHRLPLHVRGSGDAPAHAPPGGVLLDLGSLVRIATIDAEGHEDAIESGFGRIVAHPLPAPIALSQ